MQSSILVAERPTVRSWLGRIMSIIAVLFLSFDTVIHLMRIEPVRQSFAQLGYPGELILPIAVLELICLILYVLPRTSILGAVLLTGYLGGALTSQLRIGEPLFSHVLFPVYVGILLWGGLYLRDGRMLSMIVPFLDAPSTTMSKETGQGTLRSPVGLL